MTPSARPPGKSPSAFPTSREFFLKRWQEEFPVFLKVFRALAGNKPTFRPHPRSRSAAQLVWLLALELRACVEWARGNHVEWEESTPPRTLDEIITAFELAYDDLLPLLNKLDQRAWHETNVRLLTRGGVGYYELPLGEMLWAVLFDAIHHRGQLSLYIRLQGGKVPPIYGPSADEKLY